MNTDPRLSNPTDSFNQDSRVPASGVLVCQTWLELYCARRRTVGLGLLPIGWWIVSMGVWIDVRNRSLVSIGLGLSITCRSLVSIGLTLISIGPGMNWTRRLKHRLDLTSHVVYLHVQMMYELSVRVGRLSA
jgi:hypothetical protein